MKTFHGKSGERKKRKLHFIIRCLFFAVQRKIFAQWFRNANGFVKTAKHVPSLFLLRWTFFLLFLEVQKRYDVLRNCPITKTGWCSGNKNKYCRYAIGNIQNGPFFKQITMRVIFVDVSCSLLLFDFNDGWCGREK